MFVLWGLSLFDWLHRVWPKGVDGCLPPLHSLHLLVSWNSFCPWSSFVLTVSLKEKVIKKITFNKFVKQNIPKKGNFWGQKYRSISNKKSKISIDLDQSEKSVSLRGGTNCTFIQLRLLPESCDLQKNLHFDCDLIHFTNRI